MSHFTDQLKNSLEKGFIDKNHHHISPFRPELLVNQRSKRRDVLTSLIEELKVCQMFQFSVAFITESGLATIKSTLYDLHKKGIRGRIITSTYQFFNQPKVFRELLKLENVDVRIADVEAFHSKGYIFKHNEYVSLIVGSSNLTAGALKTNYEWNIKLTSHKDGEIISHFSNQFEEMWNKSSPMTSEWISSYESVYRPMFGERVAEFPSVYDTNLLKDALEIEPNTMQRSALHGIEAVRSQGNQRALVVSATGTGKTYLAAFDVRRYRPNRMLFIVHREQILQKAKTDFHRVIGGRSEDFGILSGSSRAIEAKYIFATVQTISKQETLDQFDRDAFDYVLIDESHRAGAVSYQRVIEHFTPTFLLGMTATPERSDGYDLFKLFDYNIAYEIRLQEALEEDMLCPFHYFGVTDLDIDGVQKGTEAFNRLVSEERVKQIIEKTDYYGFSGDRLCGLIFCSSKREAKRLSEELNKNCFRTCALTGSDAQDKRNEEVAKLEAGELDYILTVDIFNEGIDIPSINQVVMLRQTESSIIFIQQLGRGLRKHQSKDYVTVIDFIGNYKNNYLIPVALSDDRSLNKDTIRRKMIERSYISGTSTINFEQVAKERIYKSINSTNLTTEKVIKGAYENLKNRLGRIPMLIDFIKYNSIDPLIIGTQGNTKSHYGHLLYKLDNSPSLSEDHSKLLVMVTQELLAGKRVHENLLLQLLINKGSVSQKEFESELNDKSIYCNFETLQSVEKVLTLEFFENKDRVKYGTEPLISIKSNRYQLSSHLKYLLNNKWFYTLFVDVIEASLARSKRYDQTYPLTRFEKYSRKDACRLLNWDKDESTTVYGYRAKHNTCPIFAKVRTEQNIQDLKYGNKLVDVETLSWYMKEKSKKRHPNVQNILSYKENNIALHLFLNKDIGDDFYYMGKVDIEDSSVIDAEMIAEKSQKLVPVVKMNLLLQEHVDQQIYDYLHEQTH
ncbi:DUF3427 domain-containing protein [Exiguobacterium aurantiacum]|uniref:DUF3427 domain-containing protein n=1 Tax=Exiguobacterium aurantiacum TaxID=33987 RepID=UPI000877971A|nr:DEAD/DEAH box helicase [Exiguobacterium aurantiacum]